MNARVMVPVPEKLLREFVTHPEEFGLSARLSTARRLARLLALGAEIARQRVKEERLREVLAEWAEDEEGQETMRITRQLAYESDRI